MNVDSLLAGLSSRSPSQRLECANLLLGRVGPENTSELLRAIQAEPVQQIRIVLERLIDEAQSDVDLRSAESEQIDVRASDQSSGEDLGALIGHELSPAIGRVIFEASLEIDDFSASQTALAIRKLAQRIDALTRVASSSRRQLHYTTFSLIELIQENIPIGANAFVEVVPNDGADQDFDLESDREVLGLLISSALTNAYESNEHYGPDAQLNVEIEATLRALIVTITNRFAGVALTKGDVISMGRSTKSGTRGTGMRVVEQAASKLGYSWDIHGTAGVVTFVLRCDRVRP